MLTQSRDYIECSKSACLASRWSTPRLSSPQPPASARSPSTTSPNTPSDFARLSYYYEYR
ncbi:Acyl-CoA dehydrogenase [Operophtera brumata]|uniref:Acyl-CoA dehydrogenase n=1 Tax=Operophtera brumata TaxID=104452 RepID=A0A0L7L7W9_OPEBR|nr:Acyl-CoA dehydrogenase [Operophtera brumata]